MQSELNNSRELQEGRKQRAAALWPSLLYYNVRKAVVLVSININQQQELNPIGNIMMTLNYNRRLITSAPGFIN